MTETFHFRRKIQHFIAMDRSKMISLQDFDDVPIDLFLPPLVVLLYLLLLVTKAVFVFWQIYLFIYFFLKRSWRCNFPPKKKKRVAAQGLSVSFHIGLHGGASYGQTDGRTEVTSLPNQNPKISYQWCSASAPSARGALLTQNLGF